MLAGVDVSQWQTATPNLSGIEFIGIRATYGVTPDVRYTMHLANARKAGVPVVIAYHFGRHGAVSAQVAAFLRAAKGADLLALDLESDGTNPPMNEAEAKTFIAGVRAKDKRHIGLYHGESGFHALGEDFDWVAHWGAHPARPFSFWQYGSDPARHVDGDWYGGTLAQLLALAGKQAQAVSPDPPTILADPYGNPNPPGSLDYAFWMHAHGYVQVGGRWTAMKTTPAPTPTPVPSGLPGPSVPPTADAIPLTPTAVGADARTYPTSAPSVLTLAGLPCLRYGLGGPAFLLVHGGPEPFGAMAGMLSDLGYRIAARGGQAFMIDYHSDTWQQAVADVGAAIDAAKAAVKAPVTVVSHSFGGFPSSIAVLRDGKGDAYVSVCSVCSLAGVSTTTGAGAPDPLVLAANRPSLPVSVVRGQMDFTDTSDCKQCFVNKLHAAGHPGFHTLGPGDHTGTLYTDQTLDTLFATAKLA